MGYRLAPHLFCQRPSILRHQSFLSLLALQFRVIGSLILRETRATFGTSRLGYLWALITPVAGILVLVVIFSFAGRLPSPYGGSLALFLALGLLTLQFYTELASKLMTVFSANQALLTYPPIKAVDTVLARFILISLTYLLINMIFVIGLVWFDLADWPAHPHQLFLAFLCTAGIGLGIGTLNAIISSFFTSWQHINALINRPLFFISGIFYLPSALPPNVRNILQWNPVMQLIEWMRTGYYPDYNSLVLNIEYICVIMTVLIFLGLTGERLLRHRRI